MVVIIWVLLWINTLPTIIKLFGKDVVPVVMVDELHDEMIMPLPEHLPYHGSCVVEF